ncbi:hypothetical protein H6G33_38280 [Calothrix sp. FACHB-1219]|uniref:ParM/StbA family protein n=1 Tax=Calothrix sp. FACHB-1219 TaxID=2692778 RepID=UPI0016894450|nr:ParM/StbA family protein [Calothrix sp. FACHB-1219]MBD2222765.1 hypothetical protein [Calothrix sp. FACHB-1219]
MHRDMNTTVVEACAIDVGHANVKYSSRRSMVAGKADIRTGVFPAIAPVMVNGGFQNHNGSKKVDGVAIDIGGMQYYVGKDVRFHATGSELRTVPRNYCETDEYLALLRGALHHIAHDVGAGSAMVIETLVLGLPINTWRQYNKSLAARIEGDHLLGTITSEHPKRLVHVKKVVVIVQPLGALYQYGIATSSDPLPGWTMVLDAGGGTLDWFVSQRLQPNWPRSGAHAKSMLACCYAIADKINPEWKDQADIVGRIDFAVRTKSEYFEVQGVKYPIEQYRPAVDAVLRESVNKMFATVGKSDDLDHILITGGAAGVLHDFLCVNYPHLKTIMVVDADSLFANVKGFQIAAELVYEETR